jgi:transcriptional regulator with XRE-family HTH domain
MPPPITKEQKQELKMLGERVQRIRQEKGLTLEEVAHAVGKDRQSIHRLEKGYFNPSYVYLLEVCKGLRVKLSDLVSD